MFFQKFAHHNENTNSLFNSNIVIIIENAALNMIDIFLIWINPWLKYSAHLQTDSFIGWQKNLS